MIRFEDVTVARKGIHILKDFNLQVSRGNKVLIYGNSGIGKSTVLKLLLGFTRPDSGAIYFEDKRIDKKHVWEVRKRVAYVSQDLDIGEGNVSGFMDSVLGYNVNKAIQQHQAKRTDILDFLELEPGILDKSLDEISGGEKQRIALATAMLLEREIFLLDEVTSAIDTKLKKKVVDYFTSVAGATVLVVSHDAHWLEGSRLRVVRLGGE